MTAYLDNAATTKVCTAAAEAALNIMTESYGNPSSTHKLGRDAKKLLEASRARIASAIGAAPNEIFFTSGGTEADNWAIFSAAEYTKRRGKHIISSSAEHSAVLKALELLKKSGYEITLLKPQADGSVSVEDVVSNLREDTVLVSLMLVNSETGGITDIPAIAKALKEKKSSAILHTDAVQGFLKYPFSVKTLGADLVSLSGHKIHAPKGAGALFVKGGGRSLKLSPLLVGGLQEGALRAGTEALPSIVAFGIAAETGLSSMDESIDKMSMLKAYAIERLTSEIQGLLVLSGKAPHILNVSLPDYKGETIVNFLDGRGICVSRSSACKKGGRSHVLEAVGHPPAVIDGALRISLSRFTAKDEIEALCDGILAASQSLYKVLS
jgi:cysteine desulfurase